MKLNSGRNLSGFRNMILVLLVTGTAALLIAPAIAGTGVTISASGDRIYYLGEDITFSGTNTETSRTYLFITGPNLPVNGAQISQLDIRHYPVEDGNSSTFQIADIGSYTTWSWKWRTHNYALDAGNYTIYAVSEPEGRDTLGKAAYGTVSIRIIKPFLIRGGSTYSGPSSASGILLINSTPAGATVRIDGHNYPGMNMTPALDPYMLEGLHLISLSREGYQKYEKFVHFSGYGSHISVDATLIPDAIPGGAIHVDSTPANNTEVCVDGGLCRQLPAIFYNLTGNHFHVLTFFRNDYPILSDNVMVVPGATSEIHEIIPQDKSGIADIRINASPPGGLYCADGSNCWVWENSWMDTQFSVRENQSHTISVVKDGYRPLSTEVFIGPSRSSSQYEEINLDLLPVNGPVGNVLVNTTPGATVCLDGIRCDANVGSVNGFGMTLFTDVAANTGHTLLIKMSGYQPHASNLSVESGRTIEVNEPLIPIEPELPEVEPTGIQAIRNNWLLWWDHPQEKTKDTNPF